MEIIGDSRYTEFKYIFNNAKKVINFETNK